MKICVLYCTHLDKYLSEREFPRNKRQTKTRTHVLFSVRVSRTGSEILNRRDFIMCHCVYLEGYWCYFNEIVRLGPSTKYVEQSRILYAKTGFIISQIFADHSGRAV
jgi:hypothetical protein